MPKKVLLVDDADVFREIMTDLLSGKGHTVKAARNGTEALEQLKSKKFDLALIDLLLPGMTGFDLLREIRKEDKLKALPVLAVSGVYKGEDHINELKELGAEGFISKSLTPEQIAERVELTLSQRKKPSSKKKAGKKKTKEADPVAELDLFHDLTKRELNKMKEAMARRKFAKGEVIIKEGDEGDRFYGIVSGEVAVEKKDPSGKTAVLARLGPGAGFGELALVDKEKRSATCRAESEVETVEITRADFEKLLSENKNMERKMLRALLIMITQRLRDTGKSLTFSRALLDEMTKD